MALLGLKVKDCLTHPCTCPLIDIYGSLGKLDEDYKALDWIVYRPPHHCLAPRIIKCKLGRNEYKET